jgi:hypothetical protein
LFIFVVGNESGAQYWNPRGAPQNLPYNWLNTPGQLFVFHFVPALSRSTARHGAEIIIVNAL